MFKSKLCEVKNMFSIKRWIFRALQSKADKQLSSECLKRAQKGAEEIGAGENFLSVLLILKTLASFLLLVGRKACIFPGW